MNLPNANLPPHGAPRRPQIPADVVVHPRVHRYARLVLVAGGASFAAALFLPAITFDKTADWFDPAGTYFGYEAILVSIGLMPLAPFYGPRDCAMLTLFAIANALTLTIVATRCRLPRGRTMHAFGLVVVLILARSCWIAGIDVGGRTLHCGYVVWVSSLALIWLASALHHAASRRVTLPSPAGS